MTGKHSEEAAEERGQWYRWHNGADIGSTPGFRRGGKAKGHYDSPLTGGTTNHRPGSDCPWCIKPEGSDCRC